MIYLSVMFATGTCMHDIAELYFVLALALLYRGGWWICVGFCSNGSYRICTQCPHSAHKGGALARRARAGHLF